MKLEFYRHIFEKYSKYQISRKSIHADGRTDGRTDVTKLIVAFRNFAKSPETNTMYESYELLKNIDFEKL
jgi:hypothetical protein